MTYEEMIILPYWQYVLLSVAMAVIIVWPIMTIATWIIGGLFNFIASRHDEMRPSARTVWLDWCHPIKAAANPGATLTGAWLFVVLLVGLAAR